ncbi:MAG: hypothetical protein ACOYM1_12270, partial [Methylovulum sp.]
MENYKIQRFMMYKKQDFTVFSPDSQRISANLESAYFTLVDLQRELQELPSSMFWVKKFEKEYLTVKSDTKSNGESKGVRNQETELLFKEYKERRSYLQDRVHKIEAVLRERVSLYKRLRLPSILDRQAEILRKLDVESMLGT